MSQLHVTSHVGRDLLQSSSLFKNEASVVWEYVSNSLDYVDEGVVPNVEVQIKQRNKSITIRDNGRGLSAVDLERFFTMHGENIDRKAGKATRGMFGTGKAAAFGIARGLEVKTVHGGIYNHVKLEKKAIEASDGTAVPVQSITKNKKVDSPNGTEILIFDVVLTKIMQQSIVEYIERQLQTYRHKQPTVLVGDHLCEYRQPAVSETRVFEVPENQRRLIGDAKLTVYVAQTPLKVDQRGVAITAGEGNLIAIETGGIESKDMGEFIFGELDVPILNNASGDIQAYDLSRNLELNPLHPGASTTIGFIATKVEDVRKDLIERKREANKTEEKKKLNEEAAKIAQIINADLTEIEEKITKFHYRNQKLKNSLKAQIGGDGDTPTGTSGTEERGDIRAYSNEKEPVEKQPKNRADPEIDKPADQDKAGTGSVDPSHTGTSSTTGGGGFTVEFGNMGVESDRSEYSSDRGIIYINLDNPAIKNASKSGVDDPLFKRLAYEIAFGEYSFAAATRMMEKDPDMLGDDIIFEVRSTLNRVTRRAANLYIG